MWQTSLETNTWLFAPPRGPALNDQRQADRQTLTLTRGDDDNETSVMQDFFANLRRE